MKRLLSLLLVWGLICGIFVVPVSASETESWMNKLDESVKSMMKTANDDEMIPVWIWFTDIDQQELERRIEEETGLSQADIDKITQPTYDSVLLGIIKALQSSNLTQEERQDLIEQREAHIKAKNEAYNAWHDSYQQSKMQIAAEMYAANNSSILEVLDIPAENMMFLSTITPVAIVNADKGKIIEAAQNDSVVYLNYYEAADAVEPTEAFEPIDCQKRLERYIASNYATQYHTPDLWQYEELFEHKNAENKIDWIMIYALIDFPDLWTGMSIIGNRIIVSGTYSYFEFGMALYDVEEDIFYDLSKMTDYDKYDGLVEAIDIYGKGKLLGDLDGDEEISVVDATIIQRCEVKMRDYPESDVISPNEHIDSSFHPLTYYSDFNRDGERDILDATCIQRYLADLPYPVEK